MVDFVTANCRSFDIHLSSRVCVTLTVVNAQYGPSGRRTTMTSSSSIRATGYVVLLLVIAVAAKGQAEIETAYDPKENETTVRLKPQQLETSHPRYHSIHIAPSFRYDGTATRRPEHIDFEVQAVVKARRLRTDLYVVFLIDRETIFLSSNRSAVKNPVRRRTWVGERLVFRMPLETFIRIANAQSAAIKMGEARFELRREQFEALQDFAKAIPKNDQRTHTN